MRALIVQVFRARLEDDFHELVFVRGIFVDRDDALFCEHPGDRTLGAEVAAVLGEGVANLADRAILVVGQDVDDDGDASGAVALVGDLVVGEALELAGAALDGALDVIGGHVLRLGGEDGGAEAGIAVRVAAAGSWRRW